MASSSLAHPKLGCMCVGGQVLDRHKAMDSMVELLQVYLEEDEAYGTLLEATTQLYHYLLQPFRDMREVAMLRRQQIKVRRCSHLHLF